MITVKSITDITIIQVLKVFFYEDKNLYKY